MNLVWLGFVVCYLVLLRVCDVHVHVHPPMYMKKFHIYIDLELHNMNCYELSKSTPSEPSEGHIGPPILLLVKLRMVM